MHKQILLVCLAVLLAGCSQKSQLTGKVTYSDDGSPVNCGFVIFLTGITQARGVIGEDGMYTLSMTGNNDGIEPGEYKVYVVGVEKEIKARQRDGSYITVGREPLIDPKYTSPDTSGLVFQADSTKKSYDIQVERIKRPGRR